MTTIDFRGLGEFQLHVGQAPVPLGSPRRRTLLAVLLASANETVPPPALIEELWPDGPPRHALANLRTYASELRRQLPAVAAGRITTRSGGYRLEVCPGEFDLWRLRGQYAIARAALDRRDPAQAVAVLAPWQPVLGTGVVFGGVAAGRSSARRGLAWPRRAAGCGRLISRRASWLGGTGMWLARCGRMCGVIGWGSMATRC